jgi:hypothetical protein
MADFTSPSPEISGDVLNSLQASLSRGSVNATASSAETTSAATGVYAWISGISAITWIALLLLLSFLGVNVFMYLAKGTDTIVRVFKPIVDAVSRLFGATSSQIIDVSAEGGKGVVSAGGIL